MEITVVQALLIALFTYLGALTTPWFFGTTGGWYVLGRPLVAGAIVGAILGDVKTGVLIGVAIQAVYIGLVTPGGTVPADINFAGYIGTALAMAANAKPEVAVSMAVPIALVGTAAWQVLSVGNAFWAHLADRKAEEGDIDGIVRIDYLAQIGTFLTRFVPSFLVVYFGADVAQAIVNTIPEWMTQILTVLGGMLPAVGMAILLKQVVTDFSLLVFFLLGFTLAAYLSMPTVGVAVIGVVLAVLHYKYQFAKREA